MLIVYDDAFNTSCPETWEANYYDPRACGVKALIRQNASLILKSLGNRAVLDKKVGSLSFYRIRPPKPRKPNAPPQ